MSVGASTSIEREEARVGEVARRERGAELGAQHRRAAEPADPLGPAVPHPARLEQDRLHPLHLRDLLVERARRRVRRRELVGVRVEPGVELGAELGDVHVTHRRERRTPPTHPGNATRVRERRERPGYGTTGTRRETGR